MGYLPSTIEQNAARLAEFEKEWKHLPLPRTVIFSCRFNGREAADAFARGAEAHGARIAILEDAHRSSAIRISVVVEMDPVAEAVTDWEHRLNRLFEHEDSHYEGWRYPGPIRVSFFPESRDSNDSAAHLRASVLFGSRMVEDPVANRDIFNPERPEPFDWVPSKFLKTARRNRPANPQATVSAFSQWVYSLHNDAIGDDEDKKQGREAEEAIWRRRSEAYASNGPDFLERNGSPWELVHNGLKVHGQTSSDYFEIDGLRVGGHALRASPDLLYRHRQTGSVVITEIKYSHAKIPTNLWPNIWAQLWCYSKIDLVQQAPGVTVVGEIWADTWSPSYGRGRKRVDGQRLVSLRASARRDPRAEKFDTFFGMLFEIYSGTPTPLLPLATNIEDGL